LLSIGLIQRIGFKSHLKAFWYYCGIITHLEAKSKAETVKTTILGIYYFIEVGAMAKYNEVECFMYYMCNKWDLNEARTIFGDNLGYHVFGKWVEITSDHEHCDVLDWYGSLDKDCRDRIYNRAVELYG
jgi:hypothetical protein